MSNRHVEERMDKLLIVRLQLVNQYVFLMFLIFVIDAIGNLFLVHFGVFCVLLAIGSLLFLLSWRTKLYFNVKSAVLVWIGATLLLFYFCSDAGFYSGIAPYYFTILFAALFIFNENNRLYNVFVFLWVFILFYSVQLFDTEWSSGWEKQIYFHEREQTTLLQFLLLMMVNGYFIVLKNNKTQKLYRQALHAIRLQNPHAMLSADTTSVPLEKLVKLAQRSDSTFNAAFQQVFPEFYANLYQKNSDMTPDEFKLCALLKLGFTTKDIAKYNHLAVRTVQTKKSRLRKSFRVLPQEDLYVWITRF